MRKSKLILKKAKYLLRKSKKWYGFELKTKVGMFQ